MASHSTPSSGLLRELVDKLALLKRKRAALLDYFGDTRGHDYRRQPQLNKIDRDIKAMEAEILLVDPSHGTALTDGSVAGEGDVGVGDADASRAPEGAAGIENTDPNADPLHVLCWAVDALRGSCAAPSLRATSNKDDDTSRVCARQDDDSAFFIWLVASLNDPHVCVAALQMPHVPARWKASLIAAKVCPAATFERPVVGRTKASEFLSDAIHDAMDPTLAFMLLRHLDRSVAVHAIGIPYETGSATSADLRRAADAMSVAFRNGWSNVIDPFFLPSSMKRLLAVADAAGERRPISAQPRFDPPPHNRTQLCARAPSGSKKSNEINVADGSSRHLAKTNVLEGDTFSGPISDTSYSAADVDRLLDNAKVDCEMLEIVTDLWNRREQHFLRFPQKVVHTLLQLLWSWWQHQRESDDCTAVTPISNLCLWLPVKRSGAQHSPSSPLSSGSPLLLPERYSFHSHRDVKSSAAVILDDHTQDVMEPSLWLQSLVGSAASEIRRRCALDLSRGSEEKYWTYYMEELSNAWTEAADEHVMGAFVHGGDVTSTFPSLSVASPKSSTTARCASPLGSSTRSDSLYPAHCTSAVEHHPIAAGIEELTEGGMLRPVTLFPSVSSLLFSVQADKHVVMERNVGKTLVRCDGRMEGPASVSRVSQLNVRSDIPAPPCGAFVFSVSVPLHSSSLYRLGWADGSFPVGLCDTQDANVLLGLRDRSCGAWFHFTPLDAGSINEFHVRPYIWCNGVCLSELSTDSNGVVVTITAPSDVETTSAQSGEQAEPTATHATIYCRLQVDNRQNVVEVTFAVEDVTLSTVARLGVPPRCVGDEDVHGWFPAASFGVDAQHQQLPHASPVMRNSPPLRRDSSKGKAPPVSNVSSVSVLHQFTFDFLTHHEDFQPISPAHRPAHVLGAIHRYCKAAYYVLGFLKSKPNLIADAQSPALRLQVFLEAFIFGELQLQLNQSALLPEVFVPKALDVDDILTLCAHGAAKEHHPSNNDPNALRRLKISDRTLLRNATHRDKERDDRWFPGLVRPITRSKSRFGSMKAMNLAAQVDQWNILVDSYTSLQAPPLHAALLLGLTDVIPGLCRNDAVLVNATDSVGNTPLMLAVQLGLVDAVKILVVERQADVALQNFAGHCALHIALTNHQQEILDILLKAPGAVTRDTLNVLSRNRSNAVAIATKLALPKYVGEFLARGGLPCVPDHNGVTPLAFALRYRLLDVVHLLLLQAQSISREQLNAKDKCEPRGSALLYAAVLGDANIVRQLLQMGADATAEFSEPPATVLHAAVMARNVECLQLLLAAPDVKDNYQLLNHDGLGRGATALHLAAETQQFGMFEALAHSHADVNCPDADGRTPLMLLIVGCLQRDNSSTLPDEASVVRFAHLIKRRLKADVADKLGRTALFYAAACGYSELVTLLVESCRASVNSMDLHGYTPLTFALAHNQDHVAECLLHIAGTRINLLVARPNVAQPIEYAYHRGSVRVCRMILELGERCLPDLKQKIMAADDLARSNQIGPWGDRSRAKNAQLNTKSLVEIVRESELMKGCACATETHGTCANALLSWKAANSGDPQHRRVSSNIFGIAATVRPSVAERLTQRMLDYTATGDEAIEILQRLETIDLAVARRGETTTTAVAATTGSGVSTSFVNHSHDADDGHTDMLDLDSVASVSHLVNGHAPLDELVSELIDVFSELMPAVRSERSLRLASTQVLLLLIEARTNAARHAHLPLSTGGYEMGLPRFEALAFQSLQLNREASVVSELRRLMQMAKDSGKLFCANSATKSKWRGRNVSLLHCAIFAHNLPAVDYLLSCGADLFLEVNTSTPTPTVDFELLWPHEDAEDRCTLTGPYFRIPCPFLCALRLGNEGINVAVASHVGKLLSSHSTLRIDVETDAETSIVVEQHDIGRATQESRSPSPSSGKSKRRRSSAAFLLLASPAPREVMFTSVQVPILNAVVVLSPHHGWTQRASLVAFWKALEPLVDQLNTTDVVTGLTALQLAVVCGRSDIVEWALARRKHNLAPAVDVNMNASVSVDMAKIRRLFDGLCVRFVNELAVKRLLAEANGRRGAVNRSSTVVFSLVDLSAVCCPSVTIQIAAFGFDVGQDRKITRRASSVGLPTITSSIQKPSHQRAGRSKGSDAHRRSRTGSMSPSPPRRQSAARSTPPKRFESPSARRTTSASALTGNLSPVAVSKWGATSDIAAAFHWVGDSPLHRALRSLRHTVEAAREANGIPLSQHTEDAEGTLSRSMSVLQRSQSLRRSSVRVASEFVSFLPGKYLARGQFYDKLTDVVRFLLSLVAERMAHIRTQLADALEAAQQTAVNDEGDCVERDPDSVEAECVDAIDFAVSSMLETPLFAVDASMNTPFHTAARCGDADVMQALISTANIAIDFVARQIIRISPRAPNTSASALQQKVLEIKSDLLLANSGGGVPATLEQLGRSTCNVMDLMLEHPMAASWHSVATALLDWLPSGSRPRWIYAELLASRVHLSKLPQLVLSSNLLQGLAADVLREAAGSPPSSMLPSNVASSTRKHDCMHMVSIVALGLLFDAFSSSGPSSSSGGVSRSMEPADMQRKQMLATIIPKALLPHLNPFVGALIFSHSRLAASIWRSVQSVGSFPGRETSRDRTAASGGGANSAARPSTASHQVHQQSQKTPEQPQGAKRGTARPQTGAVATQSSRSNANVLVSSVFSLSSLEKDPSASNAAVSSSVLSAGEKVSLQHFIPPVTSDTFFCHVLTCGNSDGLAWCGAPVLKDAMEGPFDDVSQVFWYQFQALCVEFASGNQPRSAGGTSPPPLTPQPVDASVTLREWLVRTLTAAAHCGMHHVIVAARHRFFVVASNSGMSEPDRAAAHASLFHHPRVVAAACRAKHPHVVYYLLQCGAPTSRRRGLLKDAESDTPILYADDVFVGVKIYSDSRKSGVSDRGGSAERAPPRSAGISAEPLPPLATSAQRSAARMCLRALLLSRCALSETTVHLISQHPDIYDLNEQTLVYGDTLLHISVMNQSPEAIVALAHSKMFLAAAQKNHFGLRAWEYAPDPITLEHVVAKKQQSSNSSSASMLSMLHYYAAIAVLPVTLVDSLLQTGAEGSLNSSARQGLSHTKSSRSLVSHGFRTHMNIPNEVLLLLREHGFVLDYVDDASAVTSFFNVDLPVVRVTLPAAIISQRASILQSSAAPSTATTRGGGSAETFDTNVAAKTRTAADSYPYVVRPQTDYVCECELLDLSEPQRERLVLQSLAQVLGSSVKDISISDVAVSDPTTKGSAAHPQRRMSSGQGSRPDGDSGRLAAKRSKSLLSVSLLENARGLDPSTTMMIVPMYV